MDIVHEILDDSDKGARRLIDEYGGRLTAAAISLCSNEAEAKDLVSETVDIAARPFRRTIPNRRNLTARPSRKNLLSPKAFQSTTKEIRK